MRSRCPAYAGISRCSIRIASSGVSLVRDDPTAWSMRSADYGARHPTTAWPSHLPARTPRHSGSSPASSGPRRHSLHGRAAECPPPPSKLASLSNTRGEKDDAIPLARFKQPLAPRTGNRLQTQRHEARGQCTPEARQISDDGRQNRLLIRPDVSILACPGLLANNAPVQNQGADNQ